MARHAGVAIVLLISGTNGGNRFLRLCFVAMASFRRNQLKAIAIVQRLDCLLGIEPSGLERQPNSINVGLPQPRAERRAAKFGEEIVAPRHAAFLALAKAICRERTQRNTASVGVAGGRSL